jgi:acyl-coenzyme A synthetase/AMP-(fatty) acid ligase
MTGACVVVARPGGHQDPSYLADLIARAGITHIHFVPSMLEVFLEQADAGLCRSLKRVLCSGEALGYELQQRFFAHMSAELHNLYGPTEASVDVTAWRCQSEVHPGIVPIGKPIANIRVYILDAEQRPLPPGLVGEICLAGVGLARGYLGKPELTTERFVMRSVSGGRSERLYRTGDLGRYLDDGSIEYLGRVDHQVKLRGFRIELGEIEAVLTRHPAVREVVVIVREDRPGDKRLVAYLVADGGHGADTGELRRYLGQHLPAYMVPATFVFLATMPLSPNGKADRKALPRPESVSAGGDDLVAPRTRLEKLIGEIWCEVLNIANVDVHKSFFDMGGHSLLATQMVSRVNRALPVDVPLSLIFETPTLEAFARRLDELCGPQKETETAATELLDLIGEMSDAEIEALLRKDNH